MKIKILNVGLLSVCFILISFNINAQNREFSYPKLTKEEIDNRFEKLPKFEPKIKKGYLGRYTKLVHGL